jgi:hypothetical protein
VRRDEGTRSRPRLDLERSARMHNGVHVSHNRPLFQEWKVRPSWRRLLNKPLWYPHKHSGSRPACNALAYKDNFLPLAILFRRGHEFWRITMECRP